MQVGDLVKIKYGRRAGVVSIVTRMEPVPNFYKSITTPTEWAFLCDQDLPVKASKLEVINAGR